MCIRDRLKEFPDGVVLRDRAIYPNCYGRGLTVVSAVGLPHLGLAQNEILHLSLIHIFGRLGLLATLAGAHQKN